MSVFEDGLKWASRIVGTPSVVSLFNQGNAVGEATGGAGQFLRPTSRVLNIANAQLGAMNAYDGFMGGDEDAGWDGVGQAANGTISAIATGTPFGAAFTTMKMLADGGGALAGEVGGADAEFSASKMSGAPYRGLVGDDSVGSDLAEALGGGVFGTAAGLAVNITPAGLTANGADNVLGGVVNTLGNLVDDDDDRDDRWGAAKESAGDLWDWISE